MAKSKILLLALCASSLSAASFSLGGLFDAVSQKSSSVSEGPTNISEPDVLVRDLNLTNKLSLIPYIRGTAQITYGVIPMGFNSNPKLGSSSAQYKLEQIAKHPNVSLKELAFDAMQPLFNRAKEDYVKVFSNPMSKSPYAFDLSGLDQFSRVSEAEIYTFDIKTHIKIPERFVKQGKTVFETSKGPAFFKYREYQKSTQVDNPYALVCLEKVNGKVMSDKKITTTVSKDNILEYGLTCYMGGYPHGSKLDASRGRDSIKNISETQSEMPSVWKVTSFDKTQEEIYTITNRDFLMFQKEVNFQ